jgi:hypothetical protein
MFTYKVIDNFLHKDDFDVVCSIKEKENLLKTERITDHNIIDKNGNVTASGWLEAEFIKKLYNNYHNRAIQLLNELAPEKIKLIDYTFIENVQVGSHHVRRIHRDGEKNLLGIVIYIKPKINKGTFIYDYKVVGNEGKLPTRFDKKNSIEIEWKPNRAFVFSRSKESLHSFEGNNENTRFTLYYGFQRKMAESQASRRFRQIMPDSIEELQRGA